MAKGRNGNEANEKRGKWTATKWPEAAPSVHEDHILSVSIGNTHVQWALHEGVDKKLVPTLFWRTKHLDEDSLSGDPTHSLSTLIPNEVHEFIFGKVSADSDKNTAIQASTMRRVSYISIYVVSTNTEQLRLFSWLFSEIPSRIYQMQSDDFFSATDGVYPGMGVDRLATLRAAGDFSGFPALVFDAGTAATYTAADADGKILGGGIGPGVLAKLRSLADYADALPHISYTEILEEIATITAGSAPLPVFALDTKRAIITRLFSEIANEGHYVIKQFLKEVGPATVDGGGQDKENEEAGGDVKDKKVNNDRTVIVCGGDADIVSKLIEPDHSKLIRYEDKVDELPAYGVKTMRHMANYGIGSVLEKQAAGLAEDPNRETDILLIGQRVAKKFPVPDSDGDTIYRGTITIVNRVEEKNDDLYYVRYDDGDSEDMNASQLCDALNLYIQVGEKSHGADAASGDGAPPSGHKIEGAQMAANRLAASNESVKAAMEKKKKKSVAAPSASAAVPPPASAMNQPAGPPSAVAPAAAGVKRASPKPGKRGRPKKQKNLEPKEYIGMRVGKDFPAYGGTFFGTITSYHSGYWHVKYDDGDAEDYDKEEIDKLLKHYRRHKDLDTQASSPAARAPSV